MNSYDIRIFTLITRADHILAFLLLLFGSLHCQPLLYFSAPYNLIIPNNLLYPVFFFFMFSCLAHSSHFVEWNYSACLLANSSFQTQEHVKLFHRILSTTQLIFVSIFLLDTDNLIMISLLLY